MKYCRECGCDNPDEAMFCRNCGHDLMALTGTIETSKKRETGEIRPQNVSQKVVVNQNRNSLISKIFYKTDKYTGELRISKTKSISVAVFVLMFLECVVANWGAHPIVVLLASVIFGLMFSVPTFVIGYVLAIIADKISN